MNDATDGFPLDSAARVPFLPVAVTPRASTSRVIAEALRAAIVEGTLAPGAPLRQDAIARHFSVSAIPVREALRQLESEGWAKVAVNKGATVALLSADEAREIYEIRSALESLAIGLAIPAHTAATLREATTVPRRRGRRLNPSLYVARNEAFHMSLYAPAERPQLRRLITTLHRRGERYLRLKFGLPLYKDESDREHAAILDAVRQGDIPAARALVTEHLLGTGELLYHFLTERASGAAAQANGRKSRARGRARTPTTGRAESADDIRKPTTMPPRRHGARRAVLDHPAR